MFIVLTKPYYFSTLRETKASLISLETDLKSASEQTTSLRESHKRTQQAQEEAYKKNSSLEKQLTEVKLELERSRKEKDAVEASYLQAKEAADELGKQAKESKQTILDLETVAEKYRAYDNKNCDIQQAQEDKINKTEQRIHELELQMTEREKELQEFKNREERYKEQVQLQTNKIVELEKQLKDTPLNFSAEEDEAPIIKKAEERVAELEKQLQISYDENKVYKEAQDARISELVKKLEESTVAMKKLQELEGKLAASTSDCHVKQETIDKTTMRIIELEADLSASSTLRKSWESESSTLKQRIATLEHERKVLQLECSAYHTNLDNFLHKEQMYVLYCKPS